MALVLMGAVMVHLLLQRSGRTRVPAGFGVWMLFVAWVAFSVIGIDSGGRLIGFVYRFLLYAAATIAFVYVYSDRATFTLERVARLVTGFWFVIVVGGFLGLIWPLFTLRTPLARVLPNGLLANEFVGELAVRRFTQFNPDAYTVLFPRPSAPFLYTNGWGNAYSILTPVVIAFSAHLTGWRRLALSMAIVASLVPALLSLNRGMFIGLGVAALYLTARGVAAGRPQILIAVLVASIVAALAFTVLPVRNRLEFRLDSSSSTEDRSSLYQETLQRSLESPVFGYGAPRPSATPGLPSVGTQGHLWMVTFSHGIPAAAFFVSWLVIAFVNTARNRTGIGLAMHTATLVTLVEILYYGLVGMGLVVLMVLIAASWQRSEPPPIRTPTH